MSQLELENFFGPFIFCHFVHCLRGFVLNFCWFVNLSLLFVLLSKYSSCGMYLLFNLSTDQITTWYCNRHVLNKMLQVFIEVRSALWMWLPCISYLSSFKNLFNFQFLFFNFGYLFFFRIWCLFHIIATDVRIQELWIFELVLLYHRKVSCILLTTSIQLLIRVWHLDFL